MRVLITTIILWAIILGFFVTGVKVMATSPAATPIQVVETTDDNVLPRANIERDAGGNDRISPSNGVPNILRQDS